MAENLINGAAPEADLPEYLKKFRETGRSRLVKLEELFPGDQNRGLRASLEANGVGRRGKEKISAVTNSDGYVMAMGASVSRTSDSAYSALSQNINDFALDTTKRSDKIPVLYRIYRNEGMVNNAVNKSSALVAPMGNFYVRRAKLGKRPQTKVREELESGLQYWSMNVNKRPDDGAVTSAHGLSQIMEQGTRQALIEGSFIGYMHWGQMYIPSLGKKIKVPTFIQAMSSQYIEVVLPGTGLEQFVWAPPRQLINSILNAKGDDKKLVDKAYDKEFLAELKKNGKARLTASNVIHVKNRSVDFEQFGESFIEPALSDIAYKRALQNLDYVTIDSLVNRIVIVAVGSDNEKSDYHNLETAQARILGLEGMYDDAAGPNMHILWAGPDIKVIEVGAHDSILNTDGRFDIAHERIRLALGVPKSLLDGTDAGGQIWAGYEGYRETLRGIQDSWSKAWSNVGNRIAEENGFKDYELIYIPNSSTLSDKTAEANLILNAHKSGVASLRRVVAATGGDYEAERRNRLMEKGYDPDEDPKNLPTDEEIFTAPMGLPGQTTDSEGNVSRPGSEPGRPANEERTSTKPERAPENKRPNDAGQVTQ